MKPVVISDYEEFKSHAWVKSLKLKYEEEDCKLATAAKDQLVNDLKQIDDEFYKTHNRCLFTSVDGRAKTNDSFFKKLYKKWFEIRAEKGFSKEILDECYKEIKDIAGVRFSCPYHDEVKPIINNWIRPRLSDLGYAVDLQAEPLFKDKDMMDDGDRYGYRSYHFYVRVPAMINIYGDTQFCICEIQGRSELQHIWAVKSHDLLYKYQAEQDQIEDVIEDMKQLSSALRSADHFFVRIRDKIRGVGGIQ